MYSNEGLEGTSPALRSSFDSTTVRSKSVCQRRKRLALETYTVWQRNTVLSVFKHGSSSGKFSTGGVVHITWKRRGARLDAIGLTLCGRGNYAPPHQFMWDVRTAPTVSTKTLTSKSSRRSGSVKIKMPSTMITPLPSALHGRHRQQESLREGTQAHPATKAYCVRGRTAVRAQSDNTPQYYSLDRGPIVL